MRITQEKIKEFENYLKAEEKSASTIEKYVRDVIVFKEWLCKNSANKQSIVEYKIFLSNNYAVASVNAAISSLNSFFGFCGKNNLKVKTVRCQRKIFISEQKNLTRSEYELLIDIAEKQESRRLSLIMQTICTTGIRVSELKFITVEAALSGQAEISCKGKIRLVILPKKLCAVLVEYAKEKGIKSGSVFLSRKGNPLDRSNIWSEMKNLCAKAGVPPEKVFPHNLRHLFARTYYSAMKDIVRLSDVLGHSSLNTTRIYTMETGEIHRRQIEELGLLRC